MQLSSSKSTTPLSARKSALVGQIDIHGASSQWLHRMTEKCRSVCGWLPVSTYFNQVRFTPRGTSCSLLHTTVQAWQPMQLPESRTKPSRVIRNPKHSLVAAGRFRVVKYRRTRDLKDGQNCHQGFGGGGGRHRIPSGRIHEKHCVATGPHEHADRR